VIEQLAHRVTVISIDDEPNVDMNPFGKIVLGTSIRDGKHGKQVYQYPFGYMGPSSPDSYLHNLIVVDTDSYYHTSIVTRPGWVKTLAFRRRLQHDTIDAWASITENRVTVFSFKKCI